MVGVSVFDQVRASASLIWVVAAISLHIVNVFIGLAMAFQKKTPALARLHLILYCTLLFCLVYYLVLNHFHTGNSLWDYLIPLYFITLIPLSRKWDVVLHAGVTALGLILLPILILLQML